MSSDSLQVEHWPRETCTFSEEIQCRSSGFKSVELALVVELQVKSSRVACVDEREEVL